MKRTKKHRETKGPLSLSLSQMQIFLIGATGSQFPN